MDKKRQIWDEEKINLLHKRDLIPYISSSVAVDIEIRVSSKTKPATLLYHVSALHKYSGDRYTLQTGFFSKDNARGWIEENF